MAYKINKKGAKINALLDNMDSLKPKATRSSDGFMSASDKEKLEDLPSAQDLIGILAEKQDVITDLPAIRSGAEAGASAYQKPGTGIPVSDLSSEVQDMIENGGKTKSVSVNGGTPVTPDENGQVDLTVPSKTSDLENDSDFATKQEAQQMVDDAKIDTVSVDYQEDGGAPDASVSFEDGELAFSLKNMKMKFSELTAADKAEIKGEKGDQGDSAIWTGEGEPWSGLKNATGQSTTEPMTQKAVTDELLVVDEELSIVGLYAQYQVSIVPSSGKWTQGDSNNICVLIPFSSGDVLRLVPNGISSRVIVYAPLKSDAHVVGTTADFCEGYTTRIMSQQDEIVTLIAPQDAHYLYILIKALGVDQTPSMFKMRKVSSFEEDAQFEKQILRWNETPLNLLEYGTINGYINKNTNTWTGTNSTNNWGIYIPVVPGSTMRLYGATYVYAFLKSTDTHAENSVVQYAGGATMRSYVSSQGDIREVPSDARYLFVQTKTGTDYIDRVKISILTPINDQVSNLSKDGAYMMPVDMIEEYPHSFINDDGSINTVTPDHPGYAFNFCRKFPIVQGNDYYATARLGGSDTIPVVCYYDQNGTTIGFDPAFYPYRFPSGKVKSFFRQKMNVPSNAAYVIIKGSNVNVGLSLSPAEPALYIGSWQEKKDVTPYVIEYHEADVRSNLLVSDKDSDPTSATEIEDTLTKSGWAVMWPSSYASHGKPTRVIAMLHGYSGIVNSNVMGYSNLATWSDWRQKYLTEGYAVMDINGVGVSSGTEGDANSHHWGGAVSIETLDKAFEYLKTNYNVEEKMLLHGTSMGGVLAQTYAKAYPNKVLAVGLFAPASLMPFALYSSANDTIANMWGYESASDAKADGFHNMVGLAPFAECLAWKDGTLQEMDWGGIDNSGSIQETISEIVQFDLMEYFPVPIRCWQGTADASVDQSITRQTIEGYRRGGSVASIRLVEGAAHNLCTGSVGLVVEEAISWFKRYGG